MAALIEFTDKQVAAEKERDMNRFTAESTLRKLEELEQISELPPLQSYRKAVLFCALRRRDEALTIFKGLVSSDLTPEYVKERCCGYMLVYFQNQLSHHEAKPLINMLSRATDQVALQKLEDVMISGVYEDSWFEEATEEAWGPEDTIYVFDSEAREKRPLTTKLNELMWRHHHLPDSFDLFMDLVREEIYIQGKRALLAHDDVRVLFAMLESGQAVRIDILYRAKYPNQEPFDPTSKTERNKFTKYFGRLSTRLRALGISITKYQYALPPGLSYCAIFKESEERELQY
ncbi:hypothetical protein N6H14_14790 [Paenibacillus sp. CC-CFT747]|nr:hypothetical protein N6H14_14790 [Paenibacillus sp. CC-CFT747]